MTEASTTFSHPHARYLSALRAVPKAVAMGVMVVAGLTLAGWAFSPRHLAHALPEWLGMLPLTAASLVLLGAALWMLADPKRNLRARGAARAPAVAVVCVALLTPAAYLFDWGGADGWLIGRAIPGSGASPEFAPLNEALSLLLSALALLLLDVRGRGARVAQYLAIAGLANAALSLLGYVYGASSFYNIISYPGMSLHAALCFVALSVGLLCARPEGGLMGIALSESAGGFAARRLLLAAVLTPSLLGGLILLGERHSYYDAASAMSLFAASTIVTFFVIVWRSAETLHGLDAQRRGAELALRQANNELERRVAERTAELAATNEGLRREIAERRRVEEERTQLLAREQHARAQAEEWGEMIRRLQAVTDGALAHLKLDDLLREMLVRVRDLLKTDAAAILLLGEDGQKLSVRATVGLADDHRVQAELPLGKGFTGRIAATRAPLIVERSDEGEAEPPALGERLQSRIGAPLIVEGRLIGVIHAGTHDERRFNADDVRLLQLVADRVALAVEHSRLYEAERKARVEAETANRMKDDFLATVSHELRSPLNAMLGWTSLLREGKLDAEQTARALQTIENSARSQGRIISDLLDVSRIVSGKLRLNVAPIELSKVIEAAFDAVRPAADKRGVALEKWLDPQAGRMLGDADRVQQIVWNLLANAIKFTPKGGRVRVELRRKAEQLEVIVSDTGQGIKPEFLPFVFDRYRQADAKSSARQGGLGLGLAIVRNLTEMQGGQVRVSSEGEGQGATFVVTFPPAEVVLARRAQAKAGEGGDDRKGEAGRVGPAGPGTTAAQPAGPPPLAGVRVLVVDDDPHARELGQTVLTQAQAEVRAARSVAEALAILDEWNPAVLVSDIEMPEADGYALIRQVRKQGRTMPAIALTAYARAEDRSRALAAGFQMHVAKPVDPAEFVVLVASLVRRAEQASSAR